jgi:hypothetical protein
MARWTEVSAFARKGQKIFMAAIGASDTGKAVVEVAAVQIPIDHLPKVGPKEAVLFFKALLVDLLKRLKVVSNTLIIRRIVRISRPVNRAWLGHGISPR